MFRRWSKSRRPSASRENRPLYEDMHTGTTPKNMDMKQSDRAFQRRPSRKKERELLKRPSEQGRRPSDVAAKYDATLSEDNPHRITAAALTSWLKKSKEPGTSPQKSGSKKG